MKIKKNKVVSKQETEVAQRSHHVLSLLKLIIQLSDNRKKTK